LTALRLRSGTAGDSVTLHQVTPQATVKCRRCEARTETLTHILGQCTLIRSQRIRRHNDIRDFVADKISKRDNAKLIEDASFETQNGTLKPDLVIIDQGRVHVVDVTVRHEDVGYLQEGFNEKVKKCSPVLPILAEKFNVTRGKVLPVFIGSRGAIPKSTITSLEELQIIDLLCH
jgi:hypothetical protein